MNENKLHSQKQGFYFHTVDELTMDSLLYLNYEKNARSHSVAHKNAPKNRGNALSLIETWKINRG